MTRFRGGSKNCHNFKALVAVKDAFDIYSCNGPKKSLISFGDKVSLLILLWFINWKKCWISVRFSEIKCNFFFQVMVILSVIRRLLPVCV